MITEEQKQNIINEAQRERAKRGGQAVLKKLGRSHFKKMGKLAAKKRWGNKKKK